MAAIYKFRIKRVLWGNGKMPTVLTAEDGTEFKSWNLLTERWKFVPGNDIELEADGLKDEEGKTYYKISKVLTIKENYKELQVPESLTREGIDRRLRWAAKEAIKQTLGDEKIIATGLPMDTISKLAPLIIELMREDQNNEVTRFIEGNKRRYTGY